MIRITNPRLSHIADMHAAAVEKCVKKHYDEDEIVSYIRKLPGMEGKGIKEFLLCDVEAMRGWVRDVPKRLRFTVFRDIYLSLFSNGSKKFVDGDYNAYKFLREMDITVCPYCEDEYLDIVTIKEVEKRTSEIDHFFNKSQYPALAMCFYNLIPSGQNCNGLKLQNILGKSPYESDIEDCTFLRPDLPIGINMDKVDPRQCKIKFHEKNGMEANVVFLALEQRYEKHWGEVYRLMKNAQDYPEEKIDEMARMGFCGTKEEIIKNYFGPTEETEKRKSLRQKMLNDLTGY